MKRRLLMVLLIGISLFLVSCSKKKSPENSELPPPVAPSLYFENVDQVIECLESGGIVGDGEHSNIDFEDYPFLAESLERGKFPVIVNADGENVMLPRENWEMFVQHGGICTPPYIFMEFYCEINGEAIRGEFTYLSEIEKGVSLEAILNFRNKHYFIEGTGGNVEIKQLADKEVNTAPTRYRVKGGCIYILCDELIIFMENSEKRITDEFLSQITVGYIEIE